MIQITFRAQSRGHGIACRNSYHVAIPVITYVELSIGKVGQTFYYQKMQDLILKVYFATQCWVGLLPC